MSSELRHNVVSVAKIVFARLRFLSVFLIAALLVGYWDTIRNYWDKWTRPTSAAVQQAADVEYTCTMHPYVVRHEPGQCPVCGMTLVLRKALAPTTLPADVMGRVQLSPQRIALAGIATSAVEPRALVRHIHTLGVLDYNETKIARLSAWVAGRADQLFVQFVGQAVKREDPVYSLYSPDVYTALKEYLASRQRVNELPKNATPETRSDAATVYNASLQKLVLWGISQKQLDEIDHEFDQSGKIPTHLVVTSPISGIVVGKEIFEGGYVNVGDKPYTIADLETLWLQLKLYERDVPLVMIGQPVDVTVEALPNQVFHGTVTFKAFQLDPQTRTLDARVGVTNPDLRLRPGMFADASIAIPIGPGGEANEPAATTRPGMPTIPTMPQMSPKSAGIFAAALDAYLKVQTLLAADKSDGAGDLLKQLAEKVQLLANVDANLAAAAKQLAAAAQAASGQDLEAIRKSSFRDASIAMIAIGREIGTPANGKSIQVFRCPMAKADWLQSSGATANPFYGSQMIDCGAAVETLPRAQSNEGSATTVPTSQPAMRVLAIPRSAVIEAGRNRIVYVESSPGLFDMRAVQLGPLADDFYPVVGGLKDGERVVTVGAFLVDSENRLNPSSVPTTAPMP